MNSWWCHKRWASSHPWPSGSLRWSRDRWCGRRLQLLYNHIKIYTSPTWTAATRKNGNQPLQNLLLLYGATIMLQTLRLVMNSYMSSWWCHKRQASSHPWPSGSPRWSGDRWCERSPLWPGSSCSRRWSVSSLESAPGPSGSPCLSWQCSDLCSVDRRTRSK